MRPALLLVWWVLCCPDYVRNGERNSYAWSQTRLWCRYLHRHTLILAREDECLANSLDANLYILVHVCRFHWKSKLCGTKQAEIKKSSVNFLWNRGCRPALSDRGPDTNTAMRNHSLCIPIEKYIGYACIWIQWIQIHRFPCAVFQHLLFAFHDRRYIHFDHCACMVFQ